MATGYTVTDLGEYKFDPDYEDLEEQFLPIEVDAHERLVSRYYSNKDALKREQIYDKMEKFMDTQRQERLKWDKWEKEKLLETDDALFGDDLYGSDDPVGMPLDTPSVEEDSEQGSNRGERDMEPMDLTPVTTEEFYEGPLDRHDPRPPQNQAKNKDATIEYEEKFRMKPGDILVFSNGRHEPSQIPDQVGPLKSYVNVYHDYLYFHNGGEYRVNFLDKYGALMKGDIVVRFGNFNREWTWVQHSSINFYMYIADGDIPAGMERPNETPLHPWYWIDHALPLPGGRYGQPRDIVDPVPLNMPIGTLIPNFRLRYGDVLICYNIQSTQLPVQEQIETYYWNPFLESIGENRFVNHLDRVLRHGIDYKRYRHQNRRGRRKWMQTAHVYVELYYYHHTPPGGGSWIFLGSSSKRFVDHLLDHSRRLGKIKETGKVPFAGDIVFERGLRFFVDPDVTRRVGPRKGWHQGLKIGGLVHFHIWELLKEFGREPRPFVNIKTDVGKYGLGNTSIILRFGKFLQAKGGAPETPNWEWRHRTSVELFLLNTIGASWRRCAINYWPSHLPRTLPNYNWQPYNADRIIEVSPDFQVKTGDIIIRPLFNPDWVKIKSDPKYSGISSNPHYDIEMQMGIFGTSSSFDVKQGDFVIRAGYEANHINTSWTNATVELYLYAGWRNNRPFWEFQGRDAYIFGTDYWKGGLEGVQESGFGDLSVSDVETLNSFDRKEFVEELEGGPWQEQSVFQLS